jgi:hypothetical protein
MAHEDDRDPPPGVQRWLISCDESGVHGARFYGFGTLWMGWQRRGDLQAVMREVRDRHRYRSEIKWNDVSNGVLRFYSDLIETFFKTSWLTFHCLVIEKASVKKELHDGDMDLARRKHFTALLVNKIRRARKAHPARDQTFRVWVDPIASRYAKADEAVHAIANNVLKTVFGEVRPVDNVFTKDSKATPSIQLCDLLLGAVLAAWEGKVTSVAKHRVLARMAEHLGWSDLRADTKPHERKFNVWYLWDGPGTPRTPETRDVVLKYPLPVPRRG